MNRKQIAALRNIRASGTQYGIAAGFPGMTCMICDDGVFQYHVWLSFDPLRADDTIYKNLLRTADNAAAYRRHNAIKLDSAAAANAGLLAAMMQNAPALLELLAAENNARAVQEQAARDAANALYLKQQAAAQLFDALVAAIAYDDASGAHVLDGKATHVESPWIAGARAAIAAAKGIA